MTPAAMTKNNTSMTGIFQRLAALAIACQLVCSCGTVSINTSGYATLTDVQRARVKPCAGAISSLRADSNIYQVTAAQVKEHIAGQGEVIVHEFTPWCNGDQCVIPWAAEKAIRERGYGFCLVAIGYDHPERLAGVSSPKLVINTTAYGTDNFKKYCRKFFGELTGADWRDLQGNFHLFKYGRYVYTYNELKDIPAV